MWIGYKRTVFVFVILASQVFHILGCIVQSYNRNKSKAFCSHMQKCPPDSYHCHLTVCCLGCGRHSPDPKRSCKKSSDCKSIDRTKRYRCRKPGYNTKSHIQGVCCERNGY